MNTKQRINSCGSLIPFQTRANAQLVFMDSISTLIYTPELILCSTIIILQGWVYRMPHCLQTPVLLLSVSTKPLFGGA